MRWLDPEILSALIARLRKASTERARGGRAWADYADAADALEALRARVGVRKLRELEEENARQEGWDNASTWLRFCHKETRAADLLDGVSAQRSTRRSAGARLELVPATASEPGKREP